MTSTKKFWVNCHIVTLFIEIVVVNHQRTEIALADAILVPHLIVEPADKSERDLQRMVHAVEITEAIGHICQPDKPELQW